MLLEYVLNILRLLLLSRKQSSLNAQLFPVRMVLHIAEVAVGKGFTDFFLNFS